MKEGDVFLYSDREGNLDHGGTYGLGLYAADTRFLSHFRMTVNGRDPVLLSSSAERGYMGHVDLTNPDLYEGDRVSVPQQTLNIRRVRVIDGRLFERVRVKNYNPFPVAVDLAFAFGSDFADIFEVRGMLTPEHPAIEAPVLEPDRVVLAMVGRDGVRRETRISFGTKPDDLRVEGWTVHATFRLSLGPYQTKLVSLTVDPVVGDREPAPIEFDVAVHRLRRSYEEWERGCTRVVTDNELFNELLDRSLRDLRALAAPTDGGEVIEAGIPWYATVFGRDALITSHQLLSINPRPARETLRFLAARQGTKVDDWRDEQPGKILHEVRRGELAGAGIVPHTPYYGSVDSTPWFLILFAQYLRWTADLAFAEELLPAAEAALRWIDEYGDLDGDGFVEYLCRSPGGMRNQGWKDSNDAVVHADGRLAEPPIALAEVQGYVYLAKRRMADVYEALGRSREARELLAQADELRRRFNEAFWMEDERYFAMALDADKRQVRTVTSNPGHALYCGIVDEDKAVALAKRLLAPDMFSGWGVRTMSKSALAYNPMSYHNGSVWPHDNALVAAGLRRYGFDAEALLIIRGIVEAAQHFPWQRLPELFCGFPREGEGRRAPAPYPMACAPQAWAAGVPFLFVQTILGLRPDAEQRVVYLAPVFPTWLSFIEVRGLRVGGARLDMRVSRDGVTLLRNPAGLAVALRERPATVPAPEEEHDRAPVGGTRGGR